MLSKPNRSQRTTTPGHMLVQTGSSGQITGHWERITVKPDAADQTEGDHACSRTGSSNIWTSAAGYATNGIASPFRQDQRWTLGLCQDPDPAARCRMFRMAGRRNRHRAYWDRARAFAKYCASTATDCCGFSNRLLPGWVRKLRPATSAQTLNYADTGLPAFSRSSAERCR